MSVRIMLHWYNCILPVGSVLDDNMAAARLLAKVAHEEVLVDAGPELDDVDVDLDLEDLGVWIDPIGNSTAFILGKRA